MGWKSEGYIVGGKAWLVTSSYFYDDKRGEEVEITYVGRSVLKVSRGSEIIEFKSSTSKSKVFSNYYVIYKSEYESSMALIEREAKIIEFIKNRLDTLSIEQLTEIQEIIENN